MPFFESVSIIYYTIANLHQMLKFILDLQATGIYAVPYRYDQQRTPVVPYSHWREFWPMSTPSEREYTILWAEHAERCGALMLCNGLAVIDLDVKNQRPDQNIIEDFETYMILNHPDLFERLYIEESPSGGKHYCYKPWQSQKSFTLARRNSTADELAANPLVKHRTLVDYLADDKLCRIAPSKGYTAIQGSLLDLPVFTKEEHEAIILAALTLNTYVEEAVSYKSNTPVQRHPDSIRPGDFYNNNVSESDIISLVERHGFKVIGRQGCMVKLNRPGARTSGVDATINLEQRWFYTFSASLPFPHEEAVSFHYLYTQLEHGGDWTASTKAIAEQYGLEKRSTTVDVGGLRLGDFDAGAGIGEKKTAPVTDSIWNRLEKNKFSFNKVVKEQWILYHKDPFDEYASPTPLGGQGMIGVVCGESKSFKSQVIGAMESTALGRPHVTGFQMYLTEDRPEILHIDTEQSGIYAYWSVKCINFQANVGIDLPNYHAFFFREYSPTQRLKYLQELVDENPRIGVVVVDGLLDLVKNFNDEKEAAEVLQFLMTMADRGIMILCVIHTGESKTSAGKPLGHLGSTVMRKADFILRCTVENPEEEDVRFRRVLVRNPISRGLPIKQFTVMSYEKMLYLNEVPQHYRDWYTKEMGFELPPPKGSADVYLEELAKAMGNAVVKVERIEPDDFGMPITGRAAAIPPEKDDYELDEDFISIFGISEAELQRNTS